MKILITEKKMLNEMASILASHPCGTVSDCEVELEMIIFVNDSERNHLPHVHVQVRPKCDRGTNSTPVFETCVMLETAEYSFHSKKFMPFPSDDWRDLFVTLINSKSRRPRISSEQTAWEWAVMHWNTSMSANHWVEDDCKMPDYNTLSVDDSVVASIIAKLTKLFR